MFNSTGTTKIMIMKELVLSALTALLTFGVSEAAVLTAEQALARLDGAAVPASCVPV